MLLIDKHWPKRFPDDRYIDSGVRYELCKLPNTIVNLDGIRWDQARKPHKIHRHWMQTVGNFPAPIVARCPCGASCTPGGTWTK